MLKLRPHFYLSMVCSSAILGGFAPCATAASYHADGVIAEIYNGHFNTLDSYSLDLGVQAGGGVTYNVSGAHAQANSLAEGYGVHSHTYSQLSIPVVGGSYEIDAASTAIATFSDVMVSGPLGGTVTTSINLDLSGGSLVGSAADAGSLGYANTNLSVWVYVNGTVVGSGYRYDRADTRFGPSNSANGMLSTWGAANPTLVTSSFNVQSGVPFEVKLRLSTDADTVISSGNGAGGSAEANADYSHTYTFALSGPVFNLPSGYTAASAEAHIANNQAVTAGIPGDYNQNGVVDAADYVAWRKGVGATYTQADYDTWRANFGHTAGSAASNVGDTLSAVPEPSTVALIIVSSILCFILRARRFRLQCTRTETERCLRHSLANASISTILTAILWLAPAFVTSADAKNWNDGTGNWNVPGNWSPAAVPTTGEAVNIVFTDGVARTVTYNVSAPSLGLLSVDLTGSGTAASTLSIPSNFNLAANGILVGGYNGITTTNGRGAMTQSAGTATTNPGWDFVLGHGANSTGTYTLSGTGALTANQSEYIGLNGNGTFNHSAGTNTIATASGFFEIGTFAGSTGTYNLTGTGTLNVKTNEYVGDIGTGAFNQTGGTHTIDSGKNLYLGYNATGTGGTYTLSAGTLSANGATEYIGYRAAGTFNQTGGTNFFSGGTLHLAMLAGSSATYTLSAGLVSGAEETIGESGNATFTQTGGENTTQSTMMLAANAGSTATYNLSGATSIFGTGYDLRVGEGGSATVNQSGGATSAQEVFSLGFASGSSGTYNLSGGTLDVNTFNIYQTHIGYSGTGLFNQTGGTSMFRSSVGVHLGSNRGSGTFTISGGSATVAAGGLHVGPNGNGLLNVTGSGTLSIAGQLQVLNGIVNFDSGTINVASFDFFGDPSRFHWTGGTLNVTRDDVTWDSGAIGGPTAVAFGSALTLGVNQTFKITGNETLGGVGPFALTLNAGANHVVTGAMTITPAGTITQNAGSTLNATAVVQAGGIVNGTLQNQGTFTYQSGAFNGRLLNQGTVSLGPSFTAGNGIENDATMTLTLGQTLTVNGAGLDNRAAFTLAGGTINGAGPIVNNSVFTGRGTLAGTGGLVNNASLTVSGGALTLSNSGTNANSGQIDLPAGQQLQLTGAALSNTGSVQLIGGAISGTATLNNTTGVISGHGTIASPLSNSGAMVVDAGILNVSTAFSNNGEIYLAGGVATLSGTGAITNGGLLRGDGLVSRPVNNNASGEIRAESGKRIKLSGANGSNLGLIDLQGGTAEFSQPLTNASTGQIIGRGMLKAGGAGLVNNGNVALSGGITDIFGDLINATGSTTKGITISGNAGVMFWDDVTNAASSLFKVSSGSSATFFGTYAGAGVSGTGSTFFESDITPGFSPAAVDFGGNVTIGSTAKLKMELGGAAPGTQYDQMHVAGQLSLAGTLEVSLINSFTPQSGQSFDLLDWGNRSGQFSTLVLPALTASLAWDTSQLYTTGELSILSAALPGDFNQNGTVDAADYVVWRKGLGTTYTQADYNLWRNNFGATAAGAGATDSASAVAATVPEPSSIVLLVAAAIVGLVFRVRIF